MADSTPFPVKSSELSGERSGADGSALDSTNPWIGLESYTESSRRLFFGRDKEAAELVRLIRRQTITVLFGQSGLGKSSLLQAGAFPRLREADFLPLYLRLNHDSAAAPLVEQVKSALAAAFQEVGADAPAPGPDESLWEYFHRKDIDIWSNKNRLLTPVLAFDQFEEIFTLGRADDTRRARGAAFLQELADLVENRPPAALRARLDAGEVPPTRFNFDKASCQVVLILREDFLPDLEGLKGEMRSILTNRMRIRRLTGTQALEIIQKPAPHLLAEGVAERVVEFVAGARGGSADRLAELEVEPALLSVICRELNERRMKLGHETITADLVTGNRREILTDFYDRSVADLPTAMREFVEDHLLTKSGFRDNFALETALETPGVTRELIDTLVARRLLRIEEHLGVPRVELAHDVLAEVVRASRDARQQRVALKEARRHTLLLQGLAAGLVLLLAGASWIAWRAVQARRAEAAQASRTDFVVGSRLLDEGKTSEGLAYLVRAGRADPTNHVVGTRLMSELAFRNFALPVGKPLKHDGNVKWARYSKDGKRCLSHQAHSILQYWDMENRKLLQVIDLAAPLISWDWRSDDHRFAAMAPDGSVRIWDLETGRLLIGPLAGGGGTRSFILKFSPDGRWLGTGGARIWDSSTGELKATLQSETGSPKIAFSPDSNRVLTWGYLGEWRVWSVPEGSPVTPVMRTTPVHSYNSSSAFHPEGRLLAIADSPTSMRFYDAATGAAVGPKLEHDRMIYTAAHSPDGKMFATVSQDQTARIWEVPSGKALLAPLEHGEPVHYVRFSSDSRHLVTASGQRTTRVWDVSTGRLANEPMPVRVSELVPDSTKLITAEGKLVRSWQTGPGSIAPMQFSPAAGRVYVQRSPGMPTAWASFPNRLQEMDILTGRSIGAPRLFPVLVTPHVLSPDARHLLVTIIESGAQELWDLRGSEIVRRPLGRYALNQWRFTPDSSRCTMVYADNRIVRSWDTDTGTPIGQEFKLPRGKVNGFAVSPDGRSMAAASNSSYSIVWSVATREVAKTIPDDNSVMRVAYSPDGRLIASGGFSNSVHVWSATTFKAVGTPLELGDRVEDIRFSHDSRRLLTKSPWAVRMWDPVACAPLTEPMTQPFSSKDPLVGATFSDNESLIATWTAKGEVRIWDSSTGLMVVGPIRLGAPISFIAFYASDRFVTASHPQGGFSVCPLPPRVHGQGVPQWLLRLAEVLSGGEIDSNAVFRPQLREIDVLDEVRRELAAAKDDAPYVEWVRWFLADRATRPVGPGMKITAEEAKRLATPDSLLVLAENENALRRQGQYAEIEPLNREMIEITKQRHGENSPEFDFRRIRLAETLVMIAKFEEAERLARASLVFREQQGDAELQLAWARVTLGSALVGLKRFAEAEPLLAPGCGLIRRQRGNVSLRGGGLMMHVPQLILLYEATGRPEKAEEWRKYLATL